MKIGKRHSVRRAQRFVVVIAASVGYAAMTPTASADHLPQPDGNYCAVNLVAGAIGCSVTEQGYPAVRDRIIGVAPQPEFALASVQLGRFFDNAGYSTAAGFLDFYGAAACTASTADLNGAWADTTTWRPRVSSFQGLSSCRVKGWYSAGYTGSAIGYTTAATGLGVLDNHVWSAQFT